MDASERVKSLPRTRRVPTTSRYPGVMAYPATPSRTTSVAVSRQEHPGAQFGSWKGVLVAPATAADARGGRHLVQEEVPRLPGLLPLRRAGTLQGTSRDMSPAGAKPGSTARKAMNDRRSNPAPDSSRTATASCDATRTRACARGRRRAVARAHRVPGHPPDEARGGHQARHEARGDGHEERRPQHAAIDGDVAHAGQGRRAESMERRHAEVAQRHAQHRPEEGQHEALGYEEPNDAPEAGAQRLTHAQLPGPIHGARQQKGHGVEDGDEEQKAGGSEEDQQDTPRTAHHLLQQAVDARTEVGAVGKTLPSGYSTARRSARAAISVLAASTVTPGARRPTRIRPRAAAVGVPGMVALQGKPEVGGAGEETLRRGEVLGEDADDHRRAAGSTEGLPHDGRDRPRSAAPRRRG